VAAPFKEIDMRAPALRCTALALAGLALLTPAAWADATGTARLQAVEFVLIPLQDDGLPRWVNLLRTDTSVNADAALNGVGSYDVAFPLIGQSGSASYGVTGASGQAALTAETGAFRYTWAQGSATAVAGAGRWEARGFAWVFTSDILISPYTRLELHAIGSASAAQGAANETASASAAVVLNNADNSLYSRGWVNADLTGQGAGASLSLGPTPFFAAFDNNTAFSVNAYAQAYVSTSALTAAVPEPRTWALLMAGLALGAGAAARRCAAGSP
jgi:hypothetical protein